MDAQDVLYIQVVTIVVPNPTDEDLVDSLSIYTRDHVRFFYSSRTGRKRAAVMRTEYMSGGYSREVIDYWVRNELFGGIPDY